MPHYKSILKSLINPQQPKHMEKWNMCGSFGMSSITPAVIAIASSILHFLDTNCQPTQTTCVYILRHTQTHRHTGIQAHRHTDKQTHRKHRPRDTQTHRHTGTQTLIVNQLKQHVCILVDLLPYTHTHTLRMIGSRKEREVPPALNGSEISQGWKMALILGSGGDKISNFEQSSVSSKMY